ncbi:CoxG family protein [Bacillus sp. FJAT-45066]|uniref:CoxG family protein n=1 Tax=Bacillus sp. FJAT-45066 TaxID=2011010 RepID=UPI000BB770E1|nr:SRPBCC family protein [Bacillus sp. FJAT-45066]
MPTETCTIVVYKPIQSVWSFVSDINNWAPLVPGYIEHEIMNARESTWKFKSDVGMFKKKVHLKVNITSWEEPSRVTFTLTGINEKFTGYGYFSAESKTSETTIMTGALSITAEGALGKMVNNILKSSLPEMTNEFTHTVANEIENKINTY